MSDAHLDTPIVVMEREIARLDAEDRALDAKAGKRTPEQSEIDFERRRDALRGAIAALTASSSGDAAIQLQVAYTEVEFILNSDLQTEDRRGCERVLDVIDSVLMFLGNPAKPGWAQ